MAVYPEPPPLAKRHKLAKAIHRIAMAMPDAWEDHPWGDVVYKVGEKIFVFVGPNSGGMTVKAPREDAAGLCELPGIAPSAYIGRHGWITLAPEVVADLAFAEGLIHASYELIAPKKKSSPQRTQRIAKERRSI